MALLTTTSTSVAAARRWISRSSKVQATSAFANYSQSRARETSARLKDSPTDAHPSDSATERKTSHELRRTTFCPSHNNSFWFHEHAEPNWTGASASLRPLPQSLTDYCTYMMLKSSGKSYSQQRSSTTGLMYDTSYIYYSGNPRQKIQVPVSSLLSSCTMPVVSRPHQTPANHNTRLG